MKKTCAVMILAVMISLNGCGTYSVPAPADQPVSENKNTSEDQAAQVMPEDQDDEGNDKIYTGFINNESKFNGMTYEEIYAELADFERTPENYYVDVDGDGEDELLVDSVYGFDIYDIHDGALCLIAGGDGTDRMCDLYRADGHIYVGYSDFLHEGRHMLDLMRFDAEGKETEKISIYAEYPDAPEDSYDENSDFTINGEKITMKEYEDAMNKYVLIDREELR